ncbi:set domain containing [Seminavis robusta]|uniref:Set domain containing n=1 Tax=Seminavis robusta TaxID=568900 RepID=A0A9N8ES07_9STRA|nr:set domain containing [Seminavis robusta]|eukprot:Sro1789_g297680.1 set domain containing (358) ;mRNA; r:13255-14328
MILQEVATSNFLSWCDAQGIQSSLLRLQGSHPYRYLTCEKDLSPTKNDNSLSLLQVPLSACLKGDSQTALADRLTFEKMLGEDSEFYPYLCMLPPPLEDATSSLLEIPRFWSPARLASITNFDGGQLAARLEATALTDEEKLVDAWALTCVKTRSNFLKDGSYAMTPLLDMLNHDGSITTKADVSDDDDVLDLCVRGHSFSAGAEVKMSYGDLTNLDTLCQYGFVADDNPLNVETLEVGLIMAKDPITVAIASDGTIAPEALAMLRRLLAAGADLKGKNRNQLSEFMEPLSDNNELEVVSFLATELDMSAKDARRGTLEAATVREDRMVTTYLSSRASVLEKGIERILERFPDLEYC